MGTKICAMYKVRNLLLSLRDNDKLWHFFNDIWVKCSEKRRCVALRRQALGNLMRWVTRLAEPLVKWGRINWYVMLILEDKMSNSFSQLMQFEWCSAFGQGHLVHGVILCLQWKGSKPFLQGSFYLNITEITEYSRQNNKQGKLRLPFFVRVHQTTCKASIHLLNITIKGSSALVCSILVLFSLLKNSTAVLFSRNELSQFFIMLSNWLGANWDKCDNSTIVQQ